MRLLLILFVFSFIATACNSKLPGDIFEPNKMKVVFFDLLKADELANSRAAGDTSFKREAEIKKYYEQVFLIHQTNKKEFFKSYKYYQAHPDLNKILFDSLTAYATRKRASISPEKAVNPL